MSAPASVVAFAPATVANLGPGFGVLGLALDGPGETVTARLCGGSGVRLVKIEGEDGRFSGNAGANPATLAAAATLRRAGIEAGIELELVKGIPIGSGLGGSAASAAAAAYAVNLLVGSPLRKIELVGPCLEAEGAVAGRHADNVAPALLGGLILVRSVDPLDLIRLPVPEGLTIAVVTPALDPPAGETRTALPDAVPLNVLVTNTAGLAAMVAACHSGDLALLGRALKDYVATPVRSRLIPGCDAVFAAALDAGALGSSIGGAGPSVFALCRSPHSAAEVGDAMVAAFARAGLEAGSTISPADCPGARRL